MTLRRLRPNWVREDDGNWEVRIVDRETLRSVDGDRTTDIPVDIGLDGSRAIVYLDPASVGAPADLERVRAALDFLDVAYVLRGDDPSGRAR